MPMDISPTPARSASLPVDALPHVPLRASGRPRVVVLGGGFGGLWAARSLRRALVDVVLIDKKNHHLFQPLLYQVATAGLSPGDIASPIRYILRRQRNVQVLLAEAHAVDVAARRVVLDIGQVTYDALIVATGATHAYFGNDTWQAHAPGAQDARRCAGDQAEGAAGVRAARSGPAIPKRSAAC